MVNCEVGESWLGKLFWCVFFLGGDPKKYVLFFFVCAILESGV